MSVEMTCEYWHAAKAIAQQLSTKEAGVNELKKVVSYLCWLRNREETITVDQLFAYLANLAQYGEVHSGKTRQYYQTIDQACRTHLQPLQVDGDALIQILGWAARLHRA